MGMKRGGDGAWGGRGRGEGGDKEEGGGREGKGRGGTEMGKGRWWDDGELVAGAVVRIM